MRLYYVLLFCGIRDTVVLREALREFHLRIAHFSPCSVLLDQRRRAPKLLT